MELDVVETGVLTASGERWAQAETRFAVLAPMTEMHPVRLAAVDDAAEQDRLGEGRHRQGDVGGGQQRAEAQIGAELAHDPNVEPDQPHGR